MDDVTLRGEDRVMNPVEGKDTAKGTRGGVCDLAMKGRCPVDLGMKVDDGPASCGIDGVHYMDLVTQVNGLVVTEVLHRSVSTMRCGRRLTEESSDGCTWSIPAAQNPSK
jgi:hypothetical protein